MSKVQFFSKGTTFIAPEDGIYMFDTTPNEIDLTIDGVGLEPSDHNCWFPVLKGQIIFNKSYSYSGFAPYKHSN